MAAGAELWGLEMERNRSGILDIVRSMAIRTGRNIVIAIL